MRSKGREDGSDSDNCEEVTDKNSEEEEGEEEEEVDDGEVGGDGVEEGDAD